MRRVVLAVLMALLPILLFSETDEVQDGIDALLETVDLSDWDAWFRQTCGDDAVLPSDLFRQLAEMQTRMEATEAGTLLNELKPAVRPAIAKFALLMGLSVIGAALQGVSDDSPVGETARMSFRICVSAVVLILAISEIRAGIDAITAAERTAEVLLPAITGFLMLCGSENTAALLPATYTLLSDVVIKLTQTCILPMAIIGGVLLVFDAGVPGRLASVGKLLQRAAKWVLGTACSAYLLITAFRTVAAGSADGLLLKTTKLAAGSIPSVGSLLSESIDTAVRCLHFVRNALGLTGCVVLISAALKPVLSVFMARSCLRAASLLSEPLSGKPYAELLRGMGDTLHLFMLSELAVLAMSVLMIAPVFGAGGAL